MNSDRPRPLRKIPVPPGIRTLLAGIALVAMSGAATAAEPEKAYLERQFAGLNPGFGGKNTGKVRILSGPVAVKMLRGQSPGKMWRASLGEVSFKITIENKLDLDLGDCLKRLEQLPARYHKALKIVSEDKKDGVAFYENLDGAAAHGSQDYLNLVRDANALVIAHEAGHILEQRMTRAVPGTLDQWKKAVSADKISVSAYGDGAIHEDLAEFARVYAVCLDAGKDRLAELKKSSPRRFELWEKILGGDVQAAR